MADRIEIRDGKEFKVTVLPDAAPPADRKATTHFHHAEVGKPGEVGGAHYAPEYKARKRKGGRKRP